MRARGHDALFLLAVVVVGLMLPNMVIREAMADLAPADFLDQGVAISSSNEVRMPSANVSIRAVVTGSFTYDVVTNCTFRLLSNSTANCSVAFVYPRARGIGTGPECNSSLTVHVDGEPTSHVVFEWANLQTDLQRNSTYVDSRYLQQCSFAVFNLTLIADEVCTVEVNMVMRLVSSAYSFRFSYAIGTGKLWVDNTSETVRIEVEDRVGLLGLSFYPQPNATEMLTDSTTVAVWSCSVDYFESFWVGFVATQREYHGSFPAPVPYWLAVTVAVFACGIAAVHHFGKANSP